MTYIGSEHKGAWETVSWTTLAKRNLIIKSYILILGSGEKDRYRKMGTGLILPNSNNSPHKNSAGIKKFP